MKKEELRKVIYSTGGSNNPYERTEQDPLHKELEGLFHEWGENPSQNPYGEGTFNKKVGIIEDIESGKVYEIPVENIRFIN